MPPPQPAGPPVEEWPLAALLRGARLVFATAVRRALEEAGLEDLPPNGPYVLSAVSAAGAPLGAVIRQLGVSKQAAGQLVDTLVARGYLDRSPDPCDGRRLVLKPTERGLAGATVVRNVAGSLESEIAQASGSDRLDTTRMVLAELINRGVERAPTISDRSDRA